MFDQVAQQIKKCEKMYAFYVLMVFVDLRYSNHVFHTPNMILSGPENSDITGSHMLTRKNPEKMAKVEKVNERKRCATFS